MLLALVLAQSLSLPNPQGPIFSQPSLMGSLTDFAAFGSGLAGANTGNACPYPNWILQSEDITTTWTNNADSAPRNTVRTANYALSPIGDMTADRLEIPATVAPAQYSRILQGMATGWLGGPATCSLWLKGTSASGSIPMYLLTGFPNTKTVCAFTAADWSLCSVSATTAGAGGENWYIGPSGAVAEGSFPAIDVLLWGMQCNAGLSRATYTKTTTVALGFTVKGARGEALTMPRTSVAYCTATSSSGFATSGIGSYDLRLMPANQVRMENSNAMVGPLVESARRGSLLQTEAIENAAWTKEAGAGVTPVGIWVNDGGAPNGAQTADGVHFGATTGAGFSDFYQVWSASLATDSVSCSAFVRGQRPMDGGVAQDGTTDICAYTGAAWSCGDCTFTGDGGFSRCSKSAAGSTTVNRFCKLGNNSNQNGGIARAAADLLVWGVQGESYAGPDLLASSYIPVTTVAVDRTVELPDFAFALTPTAGVCSAATIEVPSLTAFQAGSGLWAPGLSTGAAGGNFAGPYLWPYTTSIGASLSIDGSGSSAAPTGYVSATNPSTLARYIASNTGTTWRICKNAVCGTTAAGAWASPAYTRIKLFAQTTTTQAAIWTNVQVDRTWSKCR